MCVTLERVGENLVMLDLLVGTFMFEWVNILKKIEAEIYGL